MGMGFESHWDTDWFRDKAERCRQLAACVPDQTIRATLEEMAADFDAQGNVAAEAVRTAAWRQGR